MSIRMREINSSTFRWRRKLKLTPLANNFINRETRSAVIKHQIGVNSVQSHVTTAENKRRIFCLINNEDVTYIKCWCTQMANNEGSVYLLAAHSSGTWGEGAGEGQFILFESLEIRDFGFDYASGFVGSRIVNILIWEKLSWSIAHFLVKYFISFQQTSHSKGTLTIFWSFSKVHLLRFPIVCHV